MRISSQRMAVKGSLVVISGQTPPLWGGSSQQWVVWRRGSQRMCQHIETFANKANNMVQRYYCWVKNSWYRGTGIEFREDIAALGALSFWVQCPRKGRRIISKISIQKIQELEDLCSWWLGCIEKIFFSISYLPMFQKCAIGFGWTNAKNEIQIRGPEPYLKWPWR